MTTIKHELKESETHYYEPTRSVVEYLNRELQNLEPTDQASLAGKRRKFRRKKETQGTIAKDKRDTFNRMFQGFVDLVYFLEFIEEHEELHELYEESLKALFGIGIDELDKETRLDEKGNKIVVETLRRTRRHKIWHWSLFVRFLSAMLFNRKSEFVNGFDFRTPLAYVMIFQAIEAMRMRLIRSGNLDELALFNNNVINTVLWSKLLAARYIPPKNKQEHSRHKLGF